jgi:hypothetical protein
MFSLVRLGVQLIWVSVWYGGFSQGMGGSLTFLLRVPLSLVSLSLDDADVCLVFLLLLLGLDDDGAVAGSGVFPPCLSLVFLSLGDAGAVSTIIGGGS